MEGWENAETRLIKVADADIKNITDGFVARLTQCRGINEAKIELNMCAWHSEPWVVYVGHWDSANSAFDWLHSYTFVKLIDVYDWVQKKCILLG